LKIVLRVYVNYWLAIRDIISICSTFIQIEEFSFNENLASVSSYTGFQISTHTFMDIVMQSHKLLSCSFSNIKNTGTLSNHPSFPEVGKVLTAAGSIQNAVP
jgi:hypothetical protein